MNLDARKQRLSKWTTIILIGLAALIVSPLIFLVVKGIVGVAIAGVVGLAAITMAPVVGMKFANWKLRAIKNEATKNPIETMEASLINDRGILDRCQNGLTTFAGQVRGFEREVVETIREYPEDATTLNESLASMKKMLETKTIKYKIAIDAFKEKENAIKKAGRMWKMSQQAQAVFDSAGVSGEDDLLNKIKLDTAFDSVNSSLDKALAQLDSEIIELGEITQKNQKKLMSNASPNIAQNSEMTFIPDYVVVEKK